MSTTETPQRPSGLLASLLSADTFHPAEPRTLEETGLSVSLVESLVCKFLIQVGGGSGREIAKHVCLPFGVLDGILQALRTR